MSLLVMNGKSQATMATHADRACQSAACKPVSAHCGALPSGVRYTSQTKADESISLFIWLICA
jgi:hypothetical protein